MIETTRVEAEDRLSELAHRFNNGGIPFPLAVREIRQALAMSQEAFGDYLGLTGPRVSQIERGCAKPNFESLCRIAGFFGLEVGFVGKNFKIPLNEATQELVRLRQAGRS